MTPSHHKYNGSMHGFVIIAHPVPARSTPFMCKSDDSQQSIQFKNDTAARCKRCAFRSDVDIGFALFRRQTQPHPVLIINDHCHADIRDLPTAAGLSLSGCCQRGNEIDIVCQILCCLYSLLVVSSSPNKLLL